MLGSFAYPCPERIHSGSANVARSPFWARCPPMGRRKGCPERSSSREAGTSQGEHAALLLAMGEHQRQVARTLAAVVTPKVPQQVSPRAPMVMPPRPQQTAKQYEAVQEIIKLPDKSWLEWHRHELPLGAEPIPTGERHFWS